MSEQQEVMLETLADGAAKDLFESAFRQALENIDDPNTDWKKPRRISLVFTIRTDETRKMGDVEVACSTKFPGVKAVGTRIFMGKVKGRLAAVEALHQEEMFQQSKGAPSGVIEGGAKA